MRCKPQSGWRLPATLVGRIGIASYAYATWGALTASSETLPNANGWVNPYRYDGRDRVLADPATGLDWLATRAYDPTTGRFLARDPLGRAPLFFADNPYAYAGNNPVSNVDPSGQYRAAGHGSVARESGAATNHMMARVVAHHGTPGKGHRTIREGSAVTVALAHSLTASASGDAAAQKRLLGEAGILGFAAVGLGLATAFVGAAAYIAGNAGVAAIFAGAAAAPETDGASLSATGEGAVETVVAGNIGGVAVALGLLAAEYGYAAYLMSQFAAPLPPGEGSWSTTRSALNTLRAMIETPLLAIAGAALWLGNKIDMGIENLPAFLQASVVGVQLAVATVSIGTSILVGQVEGAIADSERDIGVY